VLILFRAELSWDRIYGNEVFISEMSRFEHLNHVPTRWSDLRNLTHHLRKSRGQYHHNEAVRHLHRKKNESKFFLQHLWSSIAGTDSHLGLSHIRGVSSLTLSLISDPDLGAGPTGGSIEILLTRFPQKGLDSTAIARIPVAIT